MSLYDDDRHLALEIACWLCAVSLSDDNRHPTLEIFIHPTYTGHLRKSWLRMRQWLLGRTPGAPHELGHAFGGTHAAGLHEDEQRNGLRGVSRRHGASVDHAEIQRGARETSRTRFLDLMVVSRPTLPMSEKVTFVPP